MPPPSRPEHSRERDADMDSQRVAEPVIVTPDLLRSWRLPDPGGGKEARGRTLIIGGSPQTPGAVLLAAEAALRSGAGKLQVATAATVAPHVAVALPEALVVALPETPSGALDPEGADELQDLLADASAVLVGPGMTGATESSAFVEALLPHLGGPVVLDALALARVTDDVTCLHQLGGRAILTPNPRELAKTLQIDADEVAEDPQRCARQLARLTKATVALGGATSWVASPTGSVWCDTGGSVGLGVSGSGDVRAGILSGLSARGADADQAAVWSTHLHARAGERLAASVGMVGFLARELPAEVPRVLAEIAL